MTGKGLNDILKQKEVKGEAKMKKILSVFLVITILLTIATGCSKKNDSTDTSSGAGAFAEYQYTYRTIPEAKYITPADKFAGGDGTAASPYQISNAQELALLEKKIAEDDKNVKDEYTSAHYVLTDDIEINDTEGFKDWSSKAPTYSWKPIASGLSGFKGVLDGKGFTISGLYINTNCGTKDKHSTNNFGLFDKLNGTVKNISVVNSFFAVSGNPCGVGSIAGLLLGEAVIENCTSSASFDSYDASIGGIAGKAYGGVENIGEANGEPKYSKISNCTYSGVINQAKNGAMVHLGGIIGDCDGIVENCKNAGTINFAADSADSVGGIAGLMSEGTVSGSKNEGTIHCVSNEKESLAVSGGIAGKIFVSATGGDKLMSRGAKIVNCENKGKVEGELYAGGIVGHMRNDHNWYSVTVSGCINNGFVGAKDYTGGIIGSIECMGENANGESIIIDKCTNMANISKGVSGGIIAKLFSEMGDISVKNCNNAGAISSANQHAAGIIAYWIMNSKPSNTHITLEKCENSAMISSNLSAGGIVSFMDMPVCLEMGENIKLSIKNCNNSGDIFTNSTNGYIGGILGNWGMKDISTTVENCKNTGTLYITAIASTMTADDAEIMTISRIAGGIVGRVGSGLLLTTDSDKADAKNVQADNAVLKLSGCESSGKLEVINKDSKYYKNWFGGIIGNTCAEDGFSFKVEKCTYSEFDRGLGNEDLPDVGTKK